MRWARAIFFPSHATGAGMRYNLRLLLPLDSQLSDLKQRDNSPATSDLRP